MLELLARHPEGLPQTKVAEILGAPDSSVMRLGRVLADLGYVTRCAKSRWFMLARKFLAMAQGLEAERNLVEIALPIMRELRDELCESVVLGALAPELGVGFTLAMTRSVHPFAFHVEPGTPFQLHASGPGKAMLAALPEDRLQELLPRLKLERLTAQTITSRQALVAEIAKVRRAGYAVDDGEYFDGCVCLGVAIPSDSDSGVNAIWVTGPDNRFNPRDFARLAPRVTAAARRIGDHALATPRVDMAGVKITLGRFLGDGQGDTCPACPACPVTAKITKTK
jgi:IclR family acetate operon transcriptional repressor